MKKHSNERVLPETGEGRVYVPHVAAKLYQELPLPEKTHTPRHK